MYKEEESLEILNKGRKNPLSFLHITTTHYVPFFKQKSANQFTP